MQTRRSGDATPVAILRPLLMLALASTNHLNMMRPKGLSMAKGRRKLLVGQTYNRPEEFAPLRRYADIYWLDKMDAAELDRVLPSIDSLYSHGWPKALDAGKISKMKSLR